MSAINPQSRRSQELLQKAFIELLQEKPIKKIRISEICQKAGVARPTFYAHFQTKDGILTSCIDKFWAEMLGDYVMVMLQTGVVDYAQVHSYKFFSLWSEKFKEWQACKEIDQLEVYFFNSFRKHIRKFFELYNSTHTNNTSMPTPILAEHMFNFLAGGLVATLFDWSRTGEITPPEKMAMLLDELFGLNVIMRVANKLNKEFV